MSRQVEESPPLCIRCDATMEEGFIQDRGHHNWVAVPKWIRGKLEVGFFGFAKTSGKKSMTIATWRCTSCGRLESFAND